MKGFMKACLIAVLVFVVAGIVLLVVAAAGGVTRASLRLFSDQGRLGYGPVNIRLGDGFAVNFGEDRNDFNKPGYVIDDDGTEAIYLHGTYEMTRNDYTELYVDVAAADFEILESEDGNFYIDGDSAEIKVDVDGDRLLIERVDHDKITIGFVRETSAVVYVPAGYQFENLTLEVAAGSLEIDTPLWADNCTIEVGAGSVSVDSPITAGTVSMDVGAGNIEGYGCITATEQMDLSVAVGNLALDDIQCNGSLTAECSIGSLKAEGTVLKDIRAQVDVGEIDLDLKGNGQKYNYQIEVGVGEIEVNDFSYAGLDSKVFLQGDEGAPVAELECGVGELNLDLR